MKRLLYVTQSRFWNWDNASRLRAKSVIEAFEKQQYSIEVFFLGNLSAQDHARFEATLSPAIPLHGSADAGTAGNPLREALWQFHHMPAIEFFRSLVRRAVLKVIPAPVLVSVPVKPAWFFRTARAILDPSPFAYAGAREEASFVARLVAIKPDIVCVFRLDSAWIVPACWARAVPTLVDCHDVVFQRRDSLMQGGLVNNIFASESLERSILKNADAILAIQLADTQVFRTLLPTTTVIHAGQPFDVVACPRTAKPELVFGFIGSEGVANGAALRELLETLWPQILQCAGCPVKLILAGRVCNGVTRVPPEVKVMGVVSKVSDFYNEVDVIFSVVRFGGGLKFKTVEGMAFGKAVIATDCGAEGLSPQVNSALIRANSNQSIVAAAEALSKRPELVLASKARAYEAASLYFTADAVYAQLFETVATLTQRAQKLKAPEAR